MACAWWKLSKFHVQGLLDFERKFSQTCLFRMLLAVLVELLTSARVSLSTGPQVMRLPRRLALRSGLRMPRFGLGTWQAQGGDCYQAVLEALKASAGRGRAKRDFAARGTAWNLAGAIGSE